MADSRSVTAPTRPAPILNEPDASVRMRPAVRRAPVVTADWVRSNIVPLQPELPAGHSTRAVSFSPELTSSVVPASSAPL